MNWKVNSGSLTPEERSELERRLNENKGSNFDKQYVVDTLRSFNDEYFAPERLKEYKTKYGLSDEQLELLKPMLGFGANSTESDILSYINSLTANSQTEEKNSIASILNSQRSAGFNPDLSGSAPSGESSEVPSAMFNTKDLPSNGGTGSLASKFTNVAGMLLKTASFGLQAYGLVSNSLLATASTLEGFAGTDVLNISADELGMVQDVEGTINRLIKSRGLRGRKAKQYAGYVAERINSASAVAGRLRQVSDKGIALYDSKINTFKSSDIYTDHVIAFLRDTASQQALQAEYDLKIQKETNEWLAIHPEYTADRLNRELAGEIDTANKLHAESVEASANASRASSEAKISAEKAEQEKDNTDTVKKDNEVKKLKSSLQKIELEGLDKMIKFCQEFEDMWKDQPRINWMFLPEYEKYRTYKRQLNDYYYHSKNTGNGSFKISAPGVGGIGLNF